MTVGNVAIASKIPSAAPRLRILTPYNKGNHPMWLQVIELFDPLPEEVRKNWEKRFSLTYRLWRQALWAWHLFRSSKGYDVILTGSDGGSLFFGIVQRILRRKRKRVPHIYLDFLIHLVGSKFKQNLIKHFCRFAVGGATCAIVQTRYEAEIYSRALGVPASKFCFIPYHTTKFDVQVDIADEGYIFAGGDGARDYRLLIEAVRDLPYRVIIAARRRDHFVSVDIPKNVEIVNVPAEQFLGLMARARLNVVPLIWRPQHIGGEQTYLNAMTMGKPVIVTDLNADDYIENGVSGLLTPHGDVVRLKEAIQRVMEDSDFARSLGRKAKEASFRFTPERFFDAVFELCTRSVTAL